MRLAEQPHPASSGLLALAQVCRPMKRSDNTIAAARKAAATVDDDRREVAAPLAALLFDLGLIRESLDQLQGAA